MKLRYLAIVVVFGAVASVVSGCAAESYFTLKDALGNPDMTVVRDAKEDTAQLCHGLDGCVEAWTTADAEFLRFDTIEAAEEFAQPLGDDGHHSRFVVIDFSTSNPTAERKRLMIEVIESIHNSD